MSRACYKAASLAILLSWSYEILLTNCRSNDEVYQLQVRGLTMAIHGTAENQVHAATTCTRANARYMLGPMTMNSTQVGKRPCGKNCRSHCEFDFDEQFIFLISNRYVLADVRLLVELKVLVVPLNGHGYPFAWASPKCPRTCTCPGNRWAASTCVLGEKVVGPALQGV